MSTLGNVIGALGFVPTPATMLGYHEQRRAADRDRAFQLEMWNRTNKYNSPANQARLMQQGGFSPSAMFQGSAPGAASMPSVGSHGVTPMMSDLESNPFHGFSTIAQALQSLFQVDRNVAELPKVQAEIDKLFADAKLSDAKADYQNLYNTFYNAYGKRMMENDVSEGVSRYVLNLSRARLAIEEGNIQESQRLLNLAKRDELDALKGLHGVEREKVESEVKWNTESLEFRLSNLFADTRHKNAESENYEIFNKLHSDRRFRHSYLSSALDSARKIAKDVKMSDKQIDILEEEIEKACYANDMKEFTYWTDRLNKTIETVGSAASQFYGAGALRELIHLRKIQQVPPTRVTGFGQ